MFVGFLWFGVWLMVVLKEIVEEDLTWKEAAMGQKEKEKEKEEKDTKER